MSTDETWVVKKRDPAPQLGLAPRKPAPPAPAGEAAPARELAAPSAAPSVLCIDDDADFREAIADSLVELGFRARCVQDGFDGIAEFSLEPPDVVLLDLNLP